MFRHYFVPGLNEECVIEEIIVAEKIRQRVIRLVTVVMEFGDKGYDIGCLDAVRIACAGLAAMASMPTIATMPALAKKSKHQGVN